MSIRPLNRELAEKARIELNEDPKRIDSDIQHIKDWLLKQPHISARTDDQWLVAFLRGCKFSLERTKEKLDLYYTLRTLSPEHYKYVPTLFDELMELGVCVIMPKTASADSPRLGIIRPGKYNPDKVSVSDFFSVTIMIQKILLLEDDNAVVCGTQWLVDMEGISVSHMLQITPGTLKKMGIQSQDAAPIRMKGTHYINAPSTFETILNLMKSMLNEKNRNRLFVHSNLDSLYERMPKSLLPSEYGGYGGTIKEITDSWITKRKQYHSWLEEDTKYKTVESKRPGKPKTAESLFGFEGSFRQLEVD